MENGLLPMCSAFDAAKAIVAQTRKSIPALRVTGIVLWIYTNYMHVVLMVATLVDSWTADACEP